MLTLTISFILATAILVILYFKLSMRRMVQLAEKIPGPKTLPLIGNVLEFGTSLRDIYINTVRLGIEYQSTFRIWLGHHLIIIILEPEYVEEFLNTDKSTERSYVYKFAEPWIGKGIATSTGEKWKAHRKMVTPAFNFNVLENYVDVFISDARILVKKLEPHVNGTEFNIYSYLVLSNFDSICATIMGVEMNSQKEGFSKPLKSIQRLFDGVMIRNMRPWLYPDFIFNLTPAGKSQKRDIKIVRELTESVIESRRKCLLGRPGTKSDEHDDVGRKKYVPFLDFLIKTKGEDASCEDLREEISSMLLAGYDTTATASSYVCYTLANRHDIQDKVMSELQDIFGDSDRPAEFKDLIKMKYLDQVIKETLRLYPTGPVFGRTIKEDIQIGPYLLPSGANVFISPLGTHIYPKAFPDPLKFDPDRFLQENIQDRHPYSYIPFSAGPRNCIAQKYSALLVAAKVSTLLRSYKLMPGSTPIELYIAPVLKSLSGVHVRIEPRNKK